MILLLSGEGPTDLGSSLLGGACWGTHFQPGPMAKLIEQLLEPCLGYFVFQLAHEDEMVVHFLPERDLGRKARAMRNPKALLLTGAETKVGTLFHRKQAYALGVYAQETERENNDAVLAVLFRDSDGTLSCPRTEWQDKCDSIAKGFEAAQFKGGVAMVPKPKSEAWLLCALKHNYQHCQALEDQSGNDDSPNSLKKQLAEHLEGEISRDQLNTLVEDGKIIGREIKMPSFTVFVNSLAQAADSVGLDASSLL